MPRKGSVKVRTGCLTCKARKVKCDEQKPECGRCTSIGRACEGYLEKRRLSAPFLSLARRPPGSRLNTAQSDGRAFQFFQVVVQPVLAGPVDAYFWNSLVLQFGQYHPAVRHATIAISALYEELHRDQTGQQSDACERVLYHYSAAIQGIVQADNEPLTLVTCVLFICIEYMRGNAVQAIKHCRHGMIILNRCTGRYPWISDYIVPIFRRLSIMPSFHGSWLRPAPSLALPQVEVNASSCSTFTDAQHVFDAIHCRAIRCIRSGDAHRTQLLESDSVTAEMLAEQRAVSILLCQWKISFLQNSPPAGRSAKIRLLIQCMVLQIWVSMAFEADERKYDNHMDTFHHIVKLASSIELQPSSSGLCQEGTDHGYRTKFIFEVGFTPLLYFVTIKCRQLRLRLAALSQLQRLGVSHEGLWNLDAMVYMARRIIEVEHGVILATLRDGCDAALLAADAEPFLEAGCPFVYDVQWHDAAHGVHTYHACQSAQPNLLFFVHGHSSGDGLTALGDYAQAQERRFGDGISPGRTDPLSTA